MLTCRDGKSGTLGSQASKMLCKPPGADHIASHKGQLATNQIVESSLFSSEIILMCIKKCFSAVIKTKYSCIVVLFRGRALLRTRVKLT